jgi:chemotaxis protein methyltransferase CheR
VCEKVLKRARTGLYTQLEVQRGLPIKLLAKYFQQNGENWQVRPEILSTVQFETQNLLGDFQRKGPFDVIFCRNILIYQSVENKILVIKKLHEVLRDGGCLFLGAGESLMGLSTEFQLCNLNGMVYYKKKERSALSA